MSEGAARAPDVGIYEVSPRDGLQNEAEFVSTEAKLDLIALLATSGLRRIEVASFVSPSWIPQLADADELVAVLRHSPGVRYGGWSPTKRATSAFAQRARSILREPSFPRARPTIKRT
jgi:hydroxymethylglutaryl-CoA lyase